MTETKSLKLNYRRTALIGFAFFGILLLWQVYDSWCPTFLTDIFARRMYDMSSAQLKNSDPDKILNVQWIVGIIMACDNLAALILLPIFGNLSDKTKTPIGKRMPYILTGTLVAAIAFPFIPLFFHYNNIVGMIIMMAIVLMFMMMYRNPAVALMPDITPKPLRAKANGIINIMGYFGGAFATVLGIFMVLSKYINASDTDRAKMLWVIELPFIVASILMVISAFVLFFTIKENKLAAELKDEMDLGEQMAAIETPVDDDKPMSSANKRMLLAILGAEFLWFMADNAIGTYIGNYVIYYLQSSSSKTMILTILGGVASVVGFATAGSIADRIGRKWTISSGLAITVLAYIVMIFAKPTGVVTGEHGEFSFPVILFVVWAIKGYGMALVHNCSFPMVVELCSSKKIGKFTGYYYAASMSAQTVTPILLGLVLRRTLAWGTLPKYALILVILSCTVFTCLVKNIKAKKVANVKGLEAIEGD
ncbi:MAG: MFS transporter [Lachnospiraceae bacterium]|nr:MFS transporter [Lachnospiraceae bacterium]